jgi:catechol 2,3-dioxygenase-like lactoylglutathione lyase family enzyme
MFSHVAVGISDFDRALRFYGPIMARLGLEQRFCDTSVPWAAWQIVGGGRPFFIIKHPHDGEAAAPGNGAMAAFTAPDRATVRDVHALGLAGGGTCEGPPGLRPRYHASYYATYLRDPDGNKLCFVCHADLPDDA